MNSFSIIMRRRKTKDGLQALYFVSTLHRKSVFKSLNFRIPAVWWDKKNQCIKANNAQALYIINLKQKASALALKLRLENKFIPTTEFINLVFDIKKTASGTDFFNFIDTFIRQKNYPLKHVKSYNTLKDQLQCFNSNVSFNDINYSYCVSFCSFLEIEYKNTNNTRIKKMQYLKCILNEAVRYGYLKTNPALQVRLKSEKTNRQALSKLDLQKLELLFKENKLPPAAHNVLHYFLFCCYTGLRFGDLVKFSIENIKGDVIEIIQSKTGGVVCIPLIDKARALLPEYSFKVLSNQKSNAHLKIIQKKLNITTTISCHVARHTFATIGLNSGVPMEVVSEVLGHSSTRVTKIYAKMLNQFKINEMQKWGQ